MASESAPPPSPTSNSNNNNPLISPNPSTSGLKTALHPLALLSISDYITRHTLRQNTGPIVGALLGNQQGREIAIEQAYEVLVVHASGEGERVGLNGGEEEIKIDDGWFEKRLRLFKETHPTMDLLGWFSTTTSPSFHPAWKHVSTHRTLQKYNESLVLLLLNPFVAGVSVGGKLPLGIFESVIEGGDATAQAPAGAAARANIGEGQGSGRGAGVLKFVPVEYTIETGEAEMIGVDFVAKGGWGNATAVAAAAGTASGSKAAKAEPGGASSQATAGTQASAGGDTILGATAEEGTQPVAGKEEKPEDVQANSTTPVADFVGTQNDELLANLTAKANAIRMLHSRVVLLKCYLESLPQSQPDPSNPPPGTETLSTSHPLLRSIKSLTHSRLPLLIPADYAAFKQEALAEQSDVALVALLGTLTRSVEEMREVGRRFQVVDTALPRDGPGREGASGGGGKDGGGVEGRGVRGKESMLGGMFAERFVEMGRLMRAAGR